MTPETKPGDSAPVDPDLAPTPEEERTDDVDLTPKGADHSSEVDACIPTDLRERYEFFSYKHAAILLKHRYPAEFNELCEALRKFTLTTTEIRKPGGNESDIPKKVSALLRPLGWMETRINGDLIVRKETKIPGAKKKRKSVAPLETVTIENFLDGHKIDYVKNEVAFDLEWNSKDQTFDRDLYAFRAFADCRIVSVAVLVTRSSELNKVFDDLGQIVGDDGKPRFKPGGKPKLVKEKYGASTTWMGKLLYRLNTGRHGSCPVLAVGIRAKSITDWRPT
jgi:CRISPR-associated protein Csd2